MDWVKLTTDYYRDLAVATGTDATEVMWTRGLALAGELEQSGFIPDALLPSLSRRPAQARRTANALVRADLWDRVEGGYQIVNFTRINEELERLVERKRRDRDRKRASRASQRTVSAGPSADTSTDGHEESLYESESKTEDAVAAAAKTPHRGRATADLPPPLEILRAALEAHRLTVRWDRLTREQIAEVEHLIDTHGDTALVQAAVRAFQPNKPAAFAQAWLPAWRELRRPGDLAAVPEPDPCPLAGHTGTTRHCVQCASERKAAR